MILRFETIGPDEKPRYMAINTDLRTYAQGRSAAAAGAEVSAEVSPEAYSYILSELNFNAWNYSNDIYSRPDLEEGLPF